MLYSVHAVFSECCTQCMWYSVKAVLGVCCTQCMWYSVKAVLGVYCVWCIRDSVYAVPGVCCTHYKLIIMRYRDRDGCFNLGFCGDGKVVDEKEKDGG
jgi:hypothetical protein